MEEEGFEAGKSETCRASEWQSHCSDRIQPDQVSDSHMLTSDSHMHRQLSLGPAVSALTICFLLLAGRSYAPANPEQPVTVTVDTNKSVNRFVPSQALGAGVDGHELGETARQLSPANIAAMRSAGLRPLTYRLRTELAGEAWHWNPKGTWSDAARHEGYWTSDSTKTTPIKLSYGYRLPRRGNTIDQANDDGYSRIDDGDLKTFWKSNPYLDEHFTGEKNSLHPQWLMIDLGELKEINAIRITWAAPFAKKFSVQYGDFVGEEDLSQRLPTDWREFPAGNIQGTIASRQPIQLSEQPLKVRYVRLRLDESSGAGPRQTKDIRDRLGFAIREISLGMIDSAGRFHDVMRHGAERNKQTTIYVSSTDPWHRATDRDDNTEQPGFDFIFSSGLTNGLPMLLPAPVLYDTPENAAAEIRYLAARGYPIERVELGEEADGQFVDAEHYAQLYLQFVDALRRANPKLQFGGPSMQDIEQTQVAGRIEFGKGGWLGRFLQYLKSRDRLRDFSFFSFEWYPFGDDCGQPGVQLQDAPVMLTDALNELQQGGLTHDIPWIISEYGYSAFGARAEIDLEGALVNADSVARFLTLGGNVAYLYGYEASQVIKETECSVGNNMMFFLDENGRAGTPTTAFWGARLLAQEWVKPGDEVHELFPAASDLKNSPGEQIVTAYALRRPDGLWSLMLINKDPNQAHDVRIVFRNETRMKTFDSPIDVVQFSTGQYQLNSDREQPKPIKSNPPSHFTIKPDSAVTLPAYSLTVVRGSVPPP
jgi:hypothetical protein